MSKEKNTIEINGQRYDTSTGEAVTVRVGKAATKTTHKAAPVVPVTHVTIKKPVMDVSRSKPKHAAHHKPEAGKTLMRQAVKKPTSVKSAVKSKSKPTHSTKIVVGAAKKPAVSASKLKKAQEVPQSQLISHFASTN